MWIDYVVRNESLQYTLLIVMLLIAGTILLGACHWFVKILLKWNEQEEKKALALLQPKASPTSQFIHHRKVRTHV